MISLRSPCLSSAGGLRKKSIAVRVTLSILVLSLSALAEHRQLSGIYPHLATFNDENECGTGAVVPWADRLWVVTYAPHAPLGSTDKLYEITPGLRQIIRPESIGGTPANRMVHRESKQLFIGPYVIDEDRRVRVIPYKTMFGRPTGNARHLTDPARKIYCATMEEGLYEIDVMSLAVEELWADEQKNGRHAELPGYHGKGVYSGQGRIVYANNGEHGPQALRQPEVASGCLAEWDGFSSAWNIVRRNQFTEVTGPGGILGNEHPDRDPVWAIGWDHRSLILMLLDKGRWHSYRLPKSSHSYDGAHGWNTEWPRIRDIGERDLLMTMHGAFWRFPRAFSAVNSSGIAPRSNYLKVIGDFARWNDKVVFGCDDTAKAEFLNKRTAKGRIAAPQSQSNLWFVEPDELDQLGPVIGHGGVWVTEDVSARQVSEPFLATGYEQRWLHLAHEGAEASVVIEVDKKGDGNWQMGRALNLPARGYVPVRITEDAAWIRLRAETPLKRATAWFEFSNRDQRKSNPEPIFDGLAEKNAVSYSAGLLLTQPANMRTLSFSAVTRQSDDSASVGYYELDGNLQLKRVGSTVGRDFVETNAAVPPTAFKIDEASVLFIDDTGKRWRLPKGDPHYVARVLALPARVDREAATERDLFNCCGTFYELPAENAGGFAKIRPVATHSRLIQDYCSYRGLFIMSGVAAELTGANPHIIRSDDRRVALWVGALDDIWKLGKVRGEGGPWKDSQVSAGEPSDPYLMTGYDRKVLTLSHDHQAPVLVGIQVDLTGNGDWHTYQTFSVPTGKSVTHKFQSGFGAYWLRAVADQDCTMTAQLRYD